MPPFFNPIFFIRECVGFAFFSILGAFTGYYRAIHRNAPYMP